MSAAAKGAAILRPARPGDRAAVGVLIQAAFGVYVAELGYEPLPMLEDYGARIAAGEIYLLEESGRLLGLLVVEDLGSALEIFAVAVDPAHRGRGIGRRLMDEAEALARQLGLAEVRLYTNSLMRGNVAFYKALGYAVFDRRPHPRRVGAELVNLKKVV